MVGQPLVYLCFEGIGLRFPDGVYVCVCVCVCKETGEGDRETEGVRDRGREGYKREGGTQRATPPAHSFHAWGHKQEQEKCKFLPLLFFEYRLKLCTMLPTQPLLLILRADFGVSKTHICPLCLLVFLLDDPNSPTKAMPRPPVYKSVEPKCELTPDDYLETSL